MADLTEERAKRWDSLQPLKDIEALCKQAKKVVFELERTGRIPIQRDDSDIVLSTALSQMKHLITEVRKLRKAARLSGVSDGN